MPAPPRIPPLPPDERDEQARELLAGVSVPGAPASNIFLTLVRHPGADLTRASFRWVPDRRNRVRNPRDFAKPLAIGAPAPVLEIPFKPSRMIHFLDFSNEKMVA